MNYHRQHPAVPKTSAVIRGAAVNIVLKADQPTGRTVSGVVRDVLTRGDHPRGIKVRLADGRVGRVQSMTSASSSSSSAAAAAAAAAGSSTAADLSEDRIGAAGMVGNVQSIPNDGDGDGDGDSEQGGHRHSPFGSRGGRPPRRGGRRGGRGGGWSQGYEGPASEEQEQGVPSQQIGLDAYVKEARPNRKGKPKGSSSVGPTQVEPPEHEYGPSPPAATVTCPVCGAFEGDEAAVSHHVAGHFETSP